MKRLALVVVIGVIVVFLILAGLDSDKSLLPLIGIAAVVDSVNLCALSVLLLTVAFLSSAGALRLKIISTGGFYIFGIFLVYTLIGLGILRGLNFFGTPHFMAKIGALILILFGLIALANRFIPSFPIKLKIPESTHYKMARLIERGSVPAAFVLGCLVGLSEFPCTGGPYLAALALLHDRATQWRGFAYLILYNLIFILPLVVILLIASEKELLDKLQTWKKEKTGLLKLWSGLAMIVLGVIILLIN
jgi:cytochrome c biogenesis protein CcdA